MKKIIAHLILLILLVNIFWFYNTNANSIISTKNELRKIKNWDNLIIKIDTIVEKFSSNEIILKELETKINELIDEFKNNNSTKYQNIKKILSYFDIRIKFSLLKLKESKLLWKITITIINDKRCSDCNTDLIIKQLKLIQTLKNIEIKVEDFADEWVWEYLKTNNINSLPVVLFNNNEIDKNINGFLIEIPSGEYSLQIWANFNPFIKRSDKWLPILDVEKLKEIKKDCFIKWNIDAKITWLEYSELECPYCVKLHNDWTNKSLIEKYSKDLNIIFNHFPLDFHKNALIWAEILECLWEQKWSNSFYSLIEKSFSSKNSNKDFLLEEAVKLWANSEDLEKCLSENKYQEKIKKQQKNGKDIFWINWTPWNVIINNETWEYEIISGAYPLKTFEDIIDGLLK